MIANTIRTIAGAIRSRLRPAGADSTSQKNASINSNIKAFIRSKQGHPLPPRETVLSTEILIPCHNHGDCLEMALASVARSRLPMTVIDDASSDGYTPASIKDLSARFRFKLLRNEENLLQGGSINRAVRESPANLFIILNADDALFPYTPDLLIHLFNTHSSVRMVGGCSLWFRNDGTLRLSQHLPEKLGYEPIVRLYTPEEALQFTGLNDINMTQSGCAFLRSAWESVGGFLPYRERVCSHDDRDFQMRVASLFSVAVVDEPVAYWRLGRSSKKGQK